MRLDSHRNFLRLRIKDDELTFYPIGLDRVPRRHEWRFNTERAGTPPPVYVPVSPLTPHLIESPIAFAAGKDRKVRMLPRPRNLPALEGIRFISSHGHRVHEVGGQHSVSTAASLSRRVNRGWRQAACLAPS